MNAIIYTRVSTTEQAEFNNSLKVQEEICLDYAKRNKYNVSKIFKEKGESAKTTNRTELKKLLQYIQIKNQEIDYLIVFKLDRLSRNLLDYTTIISILSKYGIILKSATETIGGTPEGKLMQNIIASFAQYDNDQRSQRTISGMKQAVKEGRWVWKAPFGYKFLRRNQKPYLIPSKDKDIVIKIFNDFLNGKKQYEISEELFKYGYKINKQKVKDTLTNPVYIGKIRSSFFDFLVDGIHKPLIDETIFYRVQEILNGNIKKEYSTDKLEQFPLRKFLKCPECNRSLTGSWSTGWSKKYPYYHCVTKGCKYKPVRKEKAEYIFIEYLRSIEPREDVINDFIEGTKKYITNQQKENGKLEKVLKRELKEREKKRIRIEELVIEGTFSKNRFSRKIKEVENEINKKKVELEDIGKSLVDTESLLNYSKDFLKNLSKIWINADIGDKRVFQEVIFPDGIYIEDEKLRTDKIATIFKVLSKKKSLKSSLVSLGRFELPTTGLGILCSIHLSYRDTRLKKMLVTGYNEKY